MWITQALFLCSLLPLALVLRPFHCSLAGRRRRRRRKERRGKSNELIFLFISRFPRKGVQNYWLKRFFSGERGLGIGGCRVLSVDFNHLVSLNPQIKRIPGPLSLLKG